MQHSTPAFGAALVSGLLFALFLCIAVVVLLQVGMYAVARIVAAVGRQHIRPPFFARVHPRFGTPMVSTILTGVTAAVIALFTDFADLAGGQAGAVVGLGGTCSSRSLLRMWCPSKASLSMQLWCMHVLALGRCSLGFSYNEPSRCLCGQLACAVLDLFVFWTLHCGLCFECVLRTVVCFVHRHGVHLDPVCLLDGGTCPHVASLLHAWRHHTSRPLLQGGTAHIPSGRSKPG